MNKYLSDKLRVISLISILLVILLHSYNITANFNSGTVSSDNKYNSFIQFFFSQGISGIAVPIFFLISGYLFFLNFTGTIDEFLLKYKKRLKTLLLPYLIWSIWGVIFYIILQLFPQSKEFFKNDLILNYSSSKILNIIFLNPIPYQLWFLRDLIVLVIVSPLIYWIIKNCNVLPVLLLLVIWFGFVKVNFIIFSSESILFFCLGGYIALKRDQFLIKKLKDKKYWTLTFFWILIVFLKTILVFQNFDPYFLLLMHKISIFFGMIAIWSIYDMLMIKRVHPNKTVLKFSFYSFFLYLFHEPILIITKKGFFYFLGVGEIISVVIYFLAPIIVVFISIILSAFFKTTTPKFYKLITGGR